MQGCLSCRKPNNGERYIFVGDGKKVEVEAIGTFRLLLKSSTYLDLKQCTNYHAWRAKKGTLLNLVCSEVNLTSIPKHTWWIDSGTTTHISVSMQGCLSCRKPNDGERYIFVGDGKKVEVEAIGTFRLLLKSGTYLDLNETYVVPSFRRNYVSISILDKFGYTCSFGNNKFSLFQNSNLVGTGSLSYVDNLYMLDIVASYHETLQLSTQGVKRKLTD